MSQPLILIIEDEPPIRKLLRASLSDADYRINEAASGAEGIKLASVQPPDLVILDLGLPDIDGQEVIRRLREWLTSPIIILSAREQEQEKIDALDGGADDYVTKPFSVGELQARMRTALRHHQRASHEAATFTIGELKVDYESRIVMLSGVPIHLTPLEYKLLITLIKHQGKVLTHRFLLKEVWGPHHTQENHYLRVFVANLRRKVEPDAARPRFIITEQSVGYRFAGS
ncbi:response regulator transcription factor KdpE [Lacunimicrobium album]